MNPLKFTKNLQIEENKKEFSEPKKETLDDKLKGTEDKLLRTMAEMENQRRRFEKERQEAFEFGGFNFAKESLSLLDNIDRIFCTPSWNSSYMHAIQTNGYGCYCGWFGAWHHAIFKQSAHY